MSYQCELLPDEPILIETMGSDFDIKTEGETSSKQITELLEQQSQPVFLIMNLSAIASMSFDDLVSATDLATRQFALFKHPKMREAIIITSSRLFTAAAKGLSSPVFGHVKLCVVPTLEAALEHARSAH